MNSSEPTDPSQKAALTEEDKDMYRMIANMIVQLGNKNVKWLLDNVPAGFIAGCAALIIDKKLTISEWHKRVEEMRTKSIEDTRNYQMNTYTDKALEEMSDDKLSETFALEIARFIKCDKWGPPPHGSMGAMKTDCGHDNCYPSQFWPPKFATSADTVLPWLDKWQIDIFRDKFNGVIMWSIVLYSDDMHSKSVGDGMAKTFARAACIALLKANIK